MRTGIAGLLIVMCGSMCFGAEAFKDVPEGHWAAGAVRELKDGGVIQGYPDGTFRGDQPVTRYELAATLERFVEFVQESRKPLVPAEQRPGDKPQSQGVLWGEQQPRSIAEPQDRLRGGPQPRSIAAALIHKGFLPKDTKLAKDTGKHITADDLADALASVAKRLIKLEVKEETTAVTPVATPRSPAPSAAARR